MTAKDLGIVVRGIAPIIREYVGCALNPLGDRLNAIEHRLLSIRDGAQGQKGERGDEGEQGPIGPAGPQGEAGPAGKDADESRIVALETLNKELRDQIAALSQSLEKALQTVESVRGIPPPVSVSGAFIKQSGELVLSFSDGSTATAGTVVGHDGADADMDELIKHIDSELAKWPHPADGKDGLGFDDIVVEHDGERAFTFKFVQGERSKTFGEFTVPVMIHRGIWTDTQDYSYQDVVTLDGSQWVCFDASKKGRPGAGSPEATGWKLVVKKGAEGKQGRPGPEGQIGKQGPQGPQGPRGY